ncbi:hypothetical protein TraAM80_04339 [Trypanosoma rangeli]|uniref:Uncharacterized protein n=1 Tax=Trypanosoma rangeli TaxID=5698 RepID=A0A422NK18_TRYRA|nr:uncharacterized protein TraAM80_04339 [Trypanosoma rangeli]RNF05806.1 hypothetical protein TraAM80_04339 [Trypanosoma rangeli]|eukprot:RNF05806.1 hypothetical protein TraAM80_04339 [Trypanosoma rangeli]
MSASASVSSCANKRDVLNRVKEVLETYVKSGVIDREDFKDLAKKSAEAIVPPVVVGEVDRITRRRLVTFLEENGAGEAVIASIWEGEKAKVEEEKVAKEGTPEPSKTSTVGMGFSLTALRARMMKKKEELRRQREETTMTVEQVLRGDAPTVTASGAPSLSHGDTLCDSAVAEEEEPPTRRYKTESQAPLPLPSLQEVDLYADFESIPSGWRTQLQPMSM